MSRRLVIQVRFLDGRFHGRIERGRAAEWPPSPLRLFQALLAGAAPLWFRPDVERRQRLALEWLERQPPPTVVTPSARLGPTLLTYVPNNNRGPRDKPFEKDRTGKTIEPIVFDGDRTVEFSYALAPSDAAADEQAREICEMARHLRCLGWGIDLAIGSGAVIEDMAATDAPDGDGERITYRPVSVVGPGRYTRRVPTTGTLASLESVHAGKLARFAEPDTLTLSNQQPRFTDFAYTSAPTRAFVAFRFLDENDDSVSYTLDEISVLAGQLRHLAAAACAGHVSEEVIHAVILGHPANGARLSILPAPSIGHANVDGRVRRLLLAEPFGSSGELCRTLGRLLDQRALLFEGSCACPPSRLALLSVRDRVICRYSATATTWASVTPVLLPGHNERRKASAVKAFERACGLIGKSLAQANVRTPATFEINRVPFWPGSRHARRYDPRSKLAHCPRFHVRLTFDRPINGPVSIGAGRHVGFGLLAATDAD